jgi:hypothetical protein
VTRFLPLWTAEGNYAASVDRRLLQAIWPNEASYGLAVSAQPGFNQVNIAPGACAVPTQNNTGTVLCVSDAAEALELQAAPNAGTDRIDLVIAFPRSPDIGVAGATDFVFTYVNGPGAPSNPAPPAVPPGTVGLARVYRRGGTVNVVAEDITDVRPYGLAVGDLGRPPPPTGPGLASWTDATGEVWVARAGVNGGAWRRARDVLRARKYRTTGITAGTTNAFNPVPWETTAYDDYAIMTNATEALICPVAGWWDLRAACATVTPTASTRLGVAIFRNSQELARGYDSTNAGHVTAHGGPAGDVAPLQVGDSISMRVYILAPAVQLGAGYALTWLSCHYLGPR